MDRYRGRRGFLGWLVFRADVWYLKWFTRVLVREARRQRLIRPRTR
jgi:hypothetical protein